MSHPAATGHPSALRTATTQPGPAPAPLPARTHRQRPGPRTTTTSRLLHPDATAPGHARAAIRDALTRWELTHLTDDAEAITSEIISNAVTASATPEGSTPAAPITLHITADSGTLTIRAWDPDPNPPPGTPGQPGNDDEHGRGLLIIAALSTAWGWAPAPNGGKYVHATLTTTTTTATQPAREQQATP
jgi:anti-sigma regulatory factor (Ser/Thr protein kinase)